MRHLLLRLALPWALCALACGGAQSGGSAASPLAGVGSPAPQFMLQDQTGRVRQLSEYRGHPVVLYFYPRDATPGCTAEACGFRDAWDRLSATGAVVLGVSTDDVASHQRFHTEHNLPFDLLADVDGTVAGQYGVPVRMGVAMRITFLVDGEGTVRRVFEDVDPGVHAEQVISAIEALASAREPAAAP